MLGEPTTPPFSIAAFISSEANHVRALAIGLYDGLQEHHGPVHAARCVDSIISY
jgi:hypothetical protein